MRPPRTSRLARQSIAAIVIAGAGLALALGVGLPDPRAAERAFAALLGLLGCLLALSWLRSTAAGQAPDGRFSPGRQEERDAPPEAPLVEDGVRELAHLAERDVSDGHRIRCQRISRHDMASKVSTSSSI